MSNLLYKTLKENTNSSAYILDSWQTGLSIFTIGARKHVRNLVPSKGTWSFSYYPNTANHIGALRRNVVGQNHAWTKSHAPFCPKILLTFQSDANFFAKNFFESKKTENFDERTFFQFLFFLFYCFNLKKKPIHPFMNVSSSKEFYGCLKNSWLFYLDELFEQKIKPSNMNCCLIKAFRTWPLQCLKARAYHIRTHDLLTRVILHGIWSLSPYW